ncbi:MAG: hypothetical protein M3P04_14040 [Actinomycetota bacterium]|nr:hypothetical protein [Actinomycetota bacterium]
MNAGTRLRSAVCDCEVVVVRAPSEGPLLQCGGLDMLPLDAARGEALTPVAGLDGGTLLGKRYADAAASLEVLCTKAGLGVLAYAGELLEQRSARALPASD